MSIYLHTSLQSVILQTQKVSLWKL